jgi:FAD/FMN-containing dehydrogenase
VSLQTAEEVSRTLRVLTKLQCQFAIKSGGHAAFKGASNIEGGVTIDLADMNNINVSEDRTVTSLGPGNRWIDVYSTLDAMGLTVVGGRVADIGVGGLTLGGGISYFSGRYGWACDNVVNYQVKYLMFNWSRAKKSRLSSQTDRSAMSITTHIQIFISL